jgi:hypothetical protein
MWAEGEHDRALATWESILRVHPHDAVAFRLAHFVNFWLGRPQDMVASVERVIPYWSEDIAGYAMILGCRCFAQEEAGNYLAAEPSGRRAIELGWSRTRCTTTAFGRPLRGLAHARNLRQH